MSLSLSGTSSSEERVFELVGADLQKRPTAFAFGHPAGGPLYLTGPPPEGEHWLNLALGSCSARLDGQVAIQATPAADTIVVDQPQSATA